MSDNRKKEMKRSVVDFIDTNPEHPPVWVAYPGSATFEIAVRPLTGIKHQEMIDASQRIEWDEIHMTKKLKFDQDTYLKLLTAYAIADWRGLTYADLRRLVLVKVTGPAVLLHEKEFGCDEVSKLTLMRNSTGFHAWLNRVVVDVALFNREREEAAEKKQ